MLPDVALLARAVHKRHPLAVDLEYLGGLDACDDCKAEALPLQQAFLSEASRAFFAQLAKNICIRFDLFAPHICNGTVDLFTDVRSLRPRLYLGTTGARSLTSLAPTLALHPNPLPPSTPGSHHPGSHPALTPGSHPGPYPLL